MAKRGTISRPGSGPSGRVQKALRRREWHWAYWVMLAGIFLGLASLAWAGHRTLVSFSFLSRALAFCCCIGLLLPMRYYMKWLGLEKLEAVLFNVLGAGPLVCSALLWLNFLARGPDSAHDYAVTHKELLSGAYFRDVTVFFTLEGNAWADFPEARNLEVMPERPEIINATQVRITTARGLLGYEVLVATEAF